MMFKRSRVAVLAMVAVSAVSLNAQSAGDLPLPEQLVPQLSPILQSALQQSPRILQRNLDLIRADADRQIAQSRMLPNVSFSSSIYRQWEKRDDNNPVTREKFELTKKLYYNFAITQPIYQWGILENSVKVARIGEQIAQRNYDEAYRSLALEVRAAYLQLVLSKMAQRNNAFFEKRAQENVARQEARQKANQITMGELLGQQLILEEIGVVARRTESDLEFALRNFRRITGLADFSVADIPDGVPMQDANAQAVAPALDAAYLDSNALQVNALEIERAKLDNKIIAKNLYPKIGLSVGANQDQQRYTKSDAPYEVEAVYAGLTMNWTLFDGFATRAQRLQNATKLRQLEASRKDLIEIAKQDAEMSSRNVALAWTGFRIAAMKFRFAREGMTYQQQSLKSGASSQEAVDTAQAAAYSAEYVAQGALVGYLNAAAAFRSTVHADPAVHSAVSR